MPDRPTVAILGGGFAGIGAARELKEADADVILVDRHDYHTFQPLLYQVATDLLDTATVGHPLRDLFHEQDNVTIHETMVNQIDLSARRVGFADMAPMRYDYLVLGLGATVNYFGVPGAETHAFPLYSLPDAVRLKDHVLERWEAADRDPSLLDDGALNVVIVGGGPTGVETAGAMIELYRADLERDFPRVPETQARVILVEAGPALLPMFKGKIRSYAKKALEERGVEVRLGDRVTELNATRVHLASGEVVPAHTLVWAAGLQTVPLASELGLALQHGNRIAVEPDLSLPGHPEVFAVGDIAWIPDPATRNVLPQLGSVALQAGEQAGKNIARRLGGKPAEPFRYDDKGIMATIGRKAGVVQFRHGKTMTGKTAWMAWGTVHLALLATNEARGRAALDWVWSGFTHERPQRISVNPSEH